MRHFLLVTIPIIFLSGCYLPTAIRIKSSLDSGKIASIIADKACQFKSEGYSDKESFDKALLFFSNDKMANSRINRSTLNKKTGKELAMCGINLKKIISDSK